VFRPTDEQVEAVRLFLAGESMVIDALAGCLAADTVVHLNRAGKGFRSTVERLVQQLHGQAPMRRTMHGREVVQASRPWDSTIQTRIAMLDGEAIRLGTVRDAWCSGMKETWEVRTASGRSIRATAEHPFLTSTGWLNLDGLSVGDDLVVNTGRSARGRSTKPQYRYVTTRHHPRQVSNGGGTFKVAQHRLVIEAEINGLSYEDYVAILRNDPDAVDALRYLDASVHVHHDDGDTKNNARRNLVVLDGSEHHRLHADADRVLWQPGVDRIEAIRWHGEEPTYDVEVVEEPHNYVANGFVVHNTGKTSTLRLLARSTRKRGRYLAYNRAIVEDVQAIMPVRCAASTAHSLAYAKVGYRYRARMDQPRVKSHVVARYLGIDPIVITAGLPAPRRLAPGWLANHLMRAVAQFCQSADEEPSVRHFPRADGIDLPDPETRAPRWTNNRIVANELEGALRKAWQDLSHTEGHLRYSHDCYVKSWALSHPKIEADYVLLDEAQDTNPVLAAVLAEQECQVVYVGDENQQLYAWRGAVDAMAGFPDENRSTLTQTFRFGAAIADEANRVLDALDAPLRIRPNPEMISTVGAWTGDEDALLCRTNATALQAVLGAQLRNRPVHLVGGGTDLLMFARAVRDLKETGRTSYHELACFDSWAEVKSYVAEDQGAGELKLMVRLVEEFGVDAIVATIGRTVDEGPGVLTVSTGHRAKGRQWDVVRVAADFGEVDPNPAELRLRYVAFTRAKEHLDHSAFRAALPPDSAVLAPVDVTR
jgi:hypothetical protein